MARHTRNRTRTQGQPAGTRFGVWSGVSRDEVRFASSAYTETCDDSIGRPVTDSDFSLTRRDKTRYKGYSYTLSKPSDPLEKVVWKDFWYDRQYLLALGHNSTSALPAGLGAVIRARTNPSRPNVTPLTIAQDLYELPKMLKDVGKLLRTPKKLLSPKELANFHLGARFGWIPLIKDVSALLHTQDYLNARIKELHRLYDSGGLGRTIQLGSDHVVSGGIESLESNLIQVRGSVSQGTSMKYWGSIKWRPNQPTIGHNPNDAEIIRQAKLVAGGLTPEGLIQGAWDLLPWSWMVDWFSNAGDWLTQNSYSVPATPASTCVMVERNTVYQHTVLSSPPGFRDHGGVGLISSKQRTVSNGSLAARIPMIDSGRLSVLGSLFVQRFKR